MSSAEVRGHSCSRIGRGWTRRGEVDDWAALRIERAGSADLEAVRGFYARLGDASTYYRFFGLRRHIPEGELLGVVGESAHHVTLLASIGSELIGIGEFIVGKQPTEAEVAFAVADDHHRVELLPTRRN